MFETINEGKKPQRATKFSAAFDVFANENMVIGAGETTLIGLGITLDIKTFWKNASFFVKMLNLFSLSFFMQRHRLELHPRSSLRAAGLGGGVGVIDMDYRDEIKMVITNAVGVMGRYGFEYANMHIIERGDKIGQMILCRHEGWLLPAEYTKDEERNGGFGSTNE